MSPLWARALRRSWAGGASGPLLASVLVLLAAAGAAAPLFTEAAANAALARTVDAVPDTARAVDSAVVRLNGGASPTDADQRRFLDLMDDVRGTGTPEVLAFSVGQELVPRSVRRPVVVAGDVAARARLAGVEDPSAVLEVVAADEDPEGVWLPQPVADELSVSPGDQVQLAVETLDGRGEPAPTRVAGVYEVGADGRRPADPDGSTLWAGRRGGLPNDTEFVTLGAYLVVTDLTSADDLARRTGDELFWTAETRLAPRHPTLAEARITVEDVEELRQRAVDPYQVDIDDGPLRLGVASGIESIVGEAEVLARTIEDGTRTVGRAGVVVGLAAVLVATVLTLRLRAGELQALAGIGVPARRAAALVAVELLPPALVAVPVGTALASAVVRVWGPPGATTSVGLVEAVLAALVAMVLALLVVVLTTGAAAWLAARPVRAAGPLRRLPWRTGLVLLAAATVAGVAGRPERGLGLGPLDLLVPVLVAAATGAAGSAVLVLLARRAARRSALAPGRSGLAPRRAATALALRRAGGSGDERAVVLTVVTTGLAVLLWALASIGSVAATVEDRVAVRAGAEATAELKGSWELDPDAPTELTAEEGAEFVGDPSDLPPGLGNPELPPGQTVVWRSQVSVPGRTGGVDLLVVDPEPFAAAASWGASGALDGLREHLPEMAASDRELGAQLRAGGGASALPAVAVGDLGLEDGRRASVGTDFLPVSVQVIDTVEVAPGRFSNRPVLVVAADSFLLQMLNRDPRLRPSGEAFSRTQFRSELWVSDGSAGLARTLDAAGVEPVEVRTADELRGTPELVAAGFGSAYQVAIGVVLALLAAAALAFHADRTAAKHRAADVLLARAGLGTRGVSRARALEVLVIAATAAALATASVFLVAPLADRLLDPGDDGLPDVRLGVAAVDLGTLLAATVLAALLAVAAAALRGRSPSDAEVLRDA